jgi:hypothetical protein
MYMVYLYDIVYLISLILISHLNEKYLTDKNLRIEGNSMSNKSLIKFGAAFVVLAALLIFLGVNYVPRIFASSSNQRNTEFTVNQSYILHSHYHSVQSQRANLVKIRRDYLDERYPRAIVPQINSIGSVSIKRHPNTYSDWIEQRSSQSSK